jgi:hypothetical protein
MITIKPERLVKSSTKGVSYVVKTITHGQRLDLDLEISEKNEAARKLVDELRAGLIGKEENSPEFLRAMEKVKAAEDKVRVPLTLEKLLVSVHGLSLDGQNELTVGDFIKNAPSVFVVEAYNACLGTFGLTEDQQKN